MFDLDGTLIDSSELILSSYRHTARIHLGRVPPDADWLAGMGTPLLTQLRGLARDDAHAREMMSTYIAHNRAHHDALVRPFPCVRETLATLRTRGYRIGIVTSKQAAAVKMGLRACNLPASWFGSIVSSDDVERHKPDPEPVRLGLRELHETDPRAALFIGDSIHDLRAGRAAGTWTGAALWGPSDRGALSPARPDYWLAGVEVLLDVLAERPPAERGRLR